MIKKRFIVIIGWLIFILIIGLTTIAIGYYKYWYKVKNDHRIQELAYDKFHDEEEIEFIPESSEKTYSNKKL